MAAAGPSVSPVGTITMTDNGTTVVETVSLATLGYGQSGAPPEDVLQSYSNPGLALTTTIDISAYVYGVLTLHYVGGRVPINLTFNTNNVFGDASEGVPTGGSAIFDIGGQWDDGGVNFSMDPNQTMMLPVWIQIVNAVSNTQAEIPQDTRNVMVWQLTPDVDQFSAYPPTTYSGPQAAACDDGQDHLLPFARLPFSYSPPATGGSAVSCHASDPAAATTTTAATTAVAGNPCAPAHGGIGQELLASLKCTAAEAADEAKCGFGVVTLILPALKATKIIQVAKSADVIASLPAKAQPAAKFLYDLYHTKFLKSAPPGYQTAAEIRAKLARVKTAWDLMKMLPNLARAVSAHDYEVLAGDLADMAGLKACVDGMRLAMA